MPRYSITRQLLCAAVTHLAPASRALAPSLNRSIGWSTLVQRNQDRIILRFDETGGSEAVDKWCRTQPTTRFTSIEYRKETEGPFKHEFIVVRLDNGTLCRFDRRAQEDMRGHAAKEEGTISEDSAHVLNSSQQEYDELMRASEVLMTIRFPSGEDIRLILAVCRAIQTHPRAGLYSLLLYNCYFFSWTITSAVARRAYNWEQAASSESDWSKIIQDSLQSISSPGKSSDGQSKPTRARMKEWISSIGKSKQPVTTDINQDESSVKHFRDALELQLMSYRPLVANTLRKLLLRSQLSPILDREMRRHLKVALLEAKVMAAEGTAAAASMRQISDARSKPKEPEKYGELTWLNHCDIAWEVAVEAAFAAAAITAVEESKIDGATAQPEEASAEPASWEREWDRAWKEHWGSRIPENDLTAENQQLGENAASRGKQAWRTAWETSTEIGNQHVSEIAECAAKELLERLSDLDPSRVTFGEKAKQSWMTRGRKRLENAVGLSEDPSLQDYIRSRMHDHFNMVDRYGFGAYEDLRNSAEGTMCEIWVAALDILDRDALGSATS